MARPDHFMFGTDARPLTVLMKQSVEVIEKFGLSPADKNSLLRECQAVVEDLISAISSS